MNSAPFTGSSGPVSKVISSADCSLRILHLSGNCSLVGGYAPGASFWARSKGITLHASESLATAAAIDDPDALPDVCACPPEPDCCPAGRRTTERLQAIQLSAWLSRCRFSFDILSP